MHIYIADLDTICNPDDLISKLSPADIVRYQSFHREIRAKQFLVSHAIVSDIRDKFKYISIAHKDNLVVVGASDTPIGVDIEDTSKNRDFDSLAELMNFHTVKNADEFYRIFTSYEAEYKARSATNLQKHFYRIGKYMIGIVSNDLETVWVNQNLIPEQI